MTTSCSGFVSVTTDPDADVLAAAMNAAVILAMNAKNTNTVT